MNWHITHVYKYTQHRHKMHKCTYGSGVGECSTRPPTIFFWIDPSHRVALLTTRGISTKELETEAGASPASDSVRRDCLQHVSSLPDDFASIVYSFHAQKAVCMKSHHVNQVSDGRNILSRAIRSHRTHAAFCSPWRGQSESDGLHEPPFPACRYGAR